MRTIRMPTELHNLRILQLQHILEPLPQPHQHLLALLRTSPLSTRNIAFASARDGLADGFRPETDAVETFADVHDDAHYFAVGGVGFEGFADRGQHYVQPEFVDGSGAFIWEWGVSEGGEQGKEEWGGWWYL